MQIISSGDNLHENVGSFFLWKNKEIVNFLSAAVSQRALMLKCEH